MKQLLERRGALSMHKYLLFKPTHEMLLITRPMYLQSTSFGLFFLMERQGRTTSALLGGLDIHPAIVL